MSEGAEMVPDAKEVPKLANDSQRIAQEVAVGRGDLPEVHDGLLVALAGPDRPKLRFQAELHEDAKGAYEFVAERGLEGASCRPDPPRGKPWTAPGFPYRQREPVRRGRSEKSPTA